MDDMTTLVTPYRIVRIAKTPEGGEVRRPWGHYTTKALADNVCDGLNLLGDPAIRFVVEPAVTP